MKPTSPISLFLFIHLASSAPIPISHNTLTISCSQKSCREHIINPITGPNTPPTTFNIANNPHFPVHQLFPNEPIDNKPITPSSAISPSAALSVSNPISSSYLLALSSSTIQNPPQSPAAPVSSLPAKPTSALPNLRKEDAERYWASLRSATTKDKNGVEMVMSDGSVDPPQTMRCLDMQLEAVPGGYYIRHRATYVVREYSDVLVVGIVLLFLVIVICVEAVEKFGSLQNIFSRNPLRRSRERRQHGAIFLAEDEDVAFLVEKPFFLQPAPAPRFKTKTDEESENEKIPYESNGEIV
ncbi:hypothetical protein G7Y89_g6561 [Cudoniella acicularis]|uniref:Uncharacterized protein n=1 Tax=Cudoniella acicularis TaxID=354080 RepID=A0A8H4W2W5_9HELO|nr:hypothetical protein G7Y89_g6561 [Cudoniella acicularis]